MAGEGDILDDVGERVPVLHVPSQLELDVLAAAGIRVKKVAIGESAYRVVPVPEDVLSYIHRMYGEGMTPERAAEVARQKSHAISLKEVEEIARRMVADGLADGLVIGLLEIIDEERE